MDEDRKKILLIISGVAAGLIVFVLILSKFHSGSRTEKPETETRSESARISESPVPDSGEEDEFEIDEDLLYEAVEFMDLLQQEAPGQMQETLEPKERKGQAEREAIAAVLSIWDYRRDQIRDDATRQKMTMAEEKVDGLDDSYIKTKLLEVLRKAEEEFDLRQAQGWTSNPSEETEGVETSSGDQERVPHAAEQSESTAETSPQPVSSPDRSSSDTSQTGTSPYDGRKTSETDKGTPSVVPDSSSGGNSETSVSRTSSTGDTDNSTVPETVLYPHVSNHNRVSMEELDNRYPYEILTAEEKKVIDQLEEAFRNGDADELILDDPDFSFMEIMTILQAQNDILCPYLPNSLSVDQVDGRITFSGMKAAKTLYAKNEELKAEAFRKGRQLIRQDMTEKEAVIAINNYVCDRLSLDENAGMDTGADGLPVNALEDGIASCRGYANLFRHMCNAVGIDCRLDFGTISDDPQGHVWNYVKVDDSWYYCDSVWNDGGSDEYPYMFSVDLWEGRIQKYPTWGFSETDIQ